MFFQRWDISKCDDSRTKCTVLFGALTQHKEMQLFHTDIDKEDKIILSPTMGKFTEVRKYRVTYSLYHTYPNASEAGFLVMLAIFFGNDWQTVAMCHTGVNSSQMGCGYWGEATSHSSGEPENHSNNNCGRKKNKPKKEQSGETALPFKGISRQYLE